MKLILVLMAVLLTACTYVPPEAIGPVVEVCTKYGLSVRTSEYRIECFKRDK